ncbi:MAG: hypothetical protein CMN55_01065 [Sneathiella sp.]|uniref:hypothetical protein n=1 Tax=Sneathiella sp. TaxID=1964365 RepID=UPI000C5D4937|nr:hypothetical protein [Sneathiella sp.]MAL77698.1 hypothetical protein [Sneathiella sp.]
MTRYLHTGTAAIYLFLGFLLIVSRFASETFHTPLVFLGIALLAALFVTVKVAGRAGGAAGFTAIFLFCAFLLLCALATRPFYDPGFDGYAYHLSAIWDIGAGWNPFLKPHANIWADSYPNGYWVLQSYIVSLTGILLSGQVLTIGLAALLFLQAFSFYQSHGPNVMPRIPALPALIFAGLLAGNPVVIGQFLTHYVDAPLYLLGISLALFLLGNLLTGERLSLLAALACIILMVNTKTAALYYVPLIVFAALLADLVFKKSSGNLIARTLNWIKNRGLLYGGTFIIAVVVIGYKPYVTNVVDHGQLLYPAVGSIMKGNEPANVVPLSPPMKFFYGVFGRTAHSDWPIDAPVELKIPGTFQLDEFKLLRFDTRRGGFGPFFSLAFITAIAAYAIARMTARRNGKAWPRTADSLAVTAGVLLGASMFFPESWWARYVPYVWAVPVLLVTASLALTRPGALRLCARVLALITLLALCGNILAAGLGAFREGRLLHNRMQQIDMIAHYPNVKLLMFYDPPALQDQHSSSTQDGLAVWTRLLADRGIATEITRERDQFDCDMADYLNGGIYWCIVIDDTEPSIP